MVSRNRVDEGDLAAIMIKLRSRLPELEADFGVKSLGVFGSYVRGEQGDGSDLDLLVEFDSDPSLLKFIRLENRLSDLLGVQVDLVMKDSLKDTIGRKILSEVVPL